MDNWPQFANSTVAPCEFSQGPISRLVMQKEANRVVHPTLCLRTNGSDGRTAHPNGRQAQPVRRGERVRARGGGANLPVLAQEPGQVRHLRHSGAGAHLQRMRSGVCECAPISDVPARFPDRSPARALGASTRDPSVTDTRSDAIRVTTRRLSRPRAGLTPRTRGNPNHPIDFHPFQASFGARNRPPTDVHPSPFRAARRGLQVRQARQEVRHGRQLRWHA